MKLTMELIQSMLSALALSVGDEWHGHQARQAHAALLELASRPGIPTDAEAYPAEQQTVPGPASEVRVAPVADAMVEWLANLSAEGHPSIAPAAASAIAALQSLMAEVGHAQELSDAELLDAADTLRAQEGGALVNTDADPDAEDEAALAYIQSTGADPGK